MVGWLWFSHTCHWPSTGPLDFEVVNCCQQLCHVPASRMPCCCTLELLSVGSAPAPAPDRTSPTACADASGSSAPDSAKAQDLAKTICQDVKSAGEALYEAIQAGGASAQEAIQALRLATCSDASNIANSITQAAVGEPGSSLVTSFCSGGLRQEP